ncbi:general transcription factor 3C polypeptide 5-like [Saccoglossus kowalevskii]|uniref:General transcription factor 3C polypeptide 5-like n=1 Tax=Saccoglossus kowalevskii TaxID=10224 RepID=A0ABM0GW93_SACKO|nr:PREDICTED: general transcription factor 3C polypeptide 5-like [Saccoglossus kowalevskii]
MADENKDEHVPFHRKRFVCIEYPGFVKNVDKMLSTLGGEDIISKIHCDPSRRLELRFRPDDPYCHPACGNRYATTSVLLKVTKRTRKPKAGQTDSAVETQYKSEILGSVDTTYRFQGLADYQYLPVARQQDGKMESLHQKLFITKVEESCEYLNRNISLFIPPPSFSRIDIPIDYYYRPDQHRDINRSSHLIGIARARRPHNARFLNFDDKDVPDTPLDAALVSLKKMPEPTGEDEIRELFKKRPVWSKNALKSHIDIHIEKLKVLLPVVAYYFVTGPWRSLWVRLGYDPRKDPAAISYQVLDFRLRQSAAAADLPVKAKRSTFNYALPLSIHRPGPQVVHIKDCTDETGEHADGSGDATTKRNKRGESQYIFKEGSLPPHRQMFYQFADLENDQLQSIISANSQDECCDEKEGWCRSETLSKLRDVMSDMVRKTAKNKETNVQEKDVQSAQADEGDNDNSDDDDEDDEVADDTVVGDDDDDDDDSSENEMTTEILDYL